jgi:uncharacterized protein (DUF1697 family)
VNKKKPGFAGKADMTQYVAFLRGINVGGKKPIKMKELAAVISAAGFHNVRTYIASGNVILESAAKDSSRVARKIERHLLKAFNCEITVMVRTIDELRRLIKLNPFKKPKPSADEMLFVTFLASPSPVKPKRRLKSATEKMEVIALTDSAAFIVARRKKTGWFGFPHTFAEKELGVPTTTRNWTTVVKIVAAAEQ